jgi:hypothetical protein
MNEPNFVGDSDVQVNAIVDLITTLESEQRQATFKKLSDMLIVPRSCELWLTFHPRQLIPPTTLHALGPQSQGTCLGGAYPLQN